MADDFDKLKAQKDAMVARYAVGQLRILKEALRKVLPVGSATAPDSKVQAFYITMGELRALREMAEVPGEGGA